ncbi:MAG: GNAT family N-acetyltransferase [Thermomicrobiales bacterium]
MHDEHGRLLAVNDADRSPAPRFYLGRTTEGNFWRFRHDLPAGLIVRLEEILVDEPVEENPERQAATIRRIFVALLRHAPVEWMWEGPAWRFPERIVIPAGPQPERLTNKTEIDDGRFSWLADELDLIQPVFVIRDAGRIVSVCHSSRYLSRAAQAGVETLEDYRGRGFAPAVVASWAQAVRDEGREPLYSIYWENQASRAVAAKLGLILIGSDMHMG